jgi:hypothetical protein
MRDPTFVYNTQQALQKNLIAKQQNTASRRALTPLFQKKSNLLNVNAEDDRLEQRQPQGPQQHGSCGAGEGDDVAGGHGIISSHCRRAVACGWDEKEACEGQKSGGLVLYPWGILRMAHSLPGLRSTMPLALSAPNLSL